MLIELALAYIDLEVVVCKSATYFAYVCSMVVGFCRIDYYIVQVHRHNSFADLYGEYLVHYSLERRGGICQSVRHDKELERSKLCREGRLGDILGGDRQLPVSAI